LSKRNEAKAARRWTRVRVRELPAGSSVTAPSAAFVILQICRVSNPRARSTWRSLSLRSRWAHSARAGEPRQRTKERNRKTPYTNGGLVAARNLRRILKEGTLARQEVTSEISGRATGRVQKTDSQAASKYSHATTFGFGAEESEI